MANQWPIGRYPIKLENLSIGVPSSIPRPLIDAVATIGFGGTAQLRLDGEAYSFGLSRPCVRWRTPGWGMIRGDGAFDPGLLQNT